jgi:hypothetical protein
VIIITRSRDYHHGLVGLLLLKSCRGRIVMRRVIAILAVVPAVLMLACGSASDLPSSSAVSVSITPSSATIQVGQSVDLQGTATGFTQPTLDWWEQDQHDATSNGSGSEDCDDITAQNTNLIASCLFGYLTGSAMVQASSETATYHAPLTPGTYHVTLRAFQVSAEQIGASVEKRTTATITVTQ